MRRHIVKTDVGHFNRIKDIQNEVSKLATIFQNPNLIITEEELEEFKQRYSYLELQLDAWYRDSIQQIYLCKGGK